MSQRKLLLADDSITIQKVVNLTFADEGIEVITVGDGDSALEKMTQAVPDLVMADVNMPGLNGYQLCEKIRQTDELRKTPVILLVGSFEPFDEAEANRVGADDFLTKPFQSIRQLVTKVTTLLDSPLKNGDDVSAATEAAPDSKDLEYVSTVRNFAPAEEYASPDYAPADAIAPSSTELGDAGMDDELIQSGSVSSFALDETAKFETKEVSEPEFDAKTQPLSAEDLKNFSFSHPAPDEGSQTLTDITTEQYSDQRNDLQIEEQSQEINVAAPQRQIPPIIELSEEEDLLELPFDEEEWEEEEAEVSSDTSFSVSPVEHFSESSQTQFQAAEAETAAVTASNETNETNETAVSAYEQPTTAAAVESTSLENSYDGEFGVSTSAGQLSPEMIDLIAQRVVEKLSEKAVKDVAWEVVPQMADLIIKKMAEEKLKE